MFITLQVYMYHTATIIRNQEQENQVWIQTYDARNVVKTEPLVYYSSTL